MPAEHIFTNARVVTADEDFLGSVVVRNGLITDISHSPSQLPQAENLNGDYLMPGFVELHTDNLEKYMNPRPGVDWPPQSAVLAHDAQIVAAGITTVFDALSIGDVNPKGDRLRQLPIMLNAISHAEQSGDTRAEHRLHLRCELSQEKTLEIFHDLVDNPLVQLVSVMDHSPGQRQFVKLEKYRQYYQGKYHFNDQEMAEFIDLHLENSSKYSQPYRKAIVQACQEKGLAIASHDDATEAHARESAELGMCIAEFPTTVAAAELSHKLGLKILMGAPNIVRGGSHSGNVAAHELAEQGVLDILSSDYYPASLLQAARILCDSDTGHTLAQSVAKISLTPARAAGLDDRGEIGVGLRADLIRVQPGKEQFVVKHVWSGGVRVF